MDEETKLALARTQKLYLTLLGIAAAIVYRVDNSEPDKLLPRIIDHDELNTMRALVEMANREMPAPREGVDVPNEQGYIQGELL